MRNLVIQAVLAGNLLLAAGCGDAIGPESLAGTYVATEFTFAGQVSGDVLAAGGSLSITLNADGTTSGSVFVPAALNDGEDFNASLAGAFTVADGSITFTQDADTFVRDITWEVDGTRLRGAGTFSGVTITVVLTRQ
jgi:hypothetical protein